MFEWNNSYDVNLDTIDEDHRKLFHIMHSLYLASQEGATDTRIDTIVSELFDYTVYHFDHEQSLMNQYDYPQKDSHITQHKHLIAVLTQKRASRSHQPAAALAQELLNIIRNWIITHIEQTDKKLAFFIRSSNR